MLPNIYNIYKGCQLHVYLSVCVCILFICGQRFETQTDRVTWRAAAHTAVGLKVIVCVCRKQGPVCCVLLHYLFSTVQEGPGCSEEERSYKRVAIVEEFFHIIYNVHVEMDGRGGKHAGQKRTYRAVSPRSLSLSWCVDACVCVHAPWEREKK